MSEWKEFKFSDFVIINPSVKLPSKEQVSFVEMKDLVDGKRFCYPSSTRINGSGAKFQNYDTLFARITPCLENGKICQVKGLKNGCGLGSTEFLVFRGKVNTSDTDFVYYLSRWDDVRSHAEINLDGTSGRQRVPKECFNDLILKLPKNIQEQTAIASILSSLDDKIDLLHRQNATLEKMAETLFRQWFVEEAKEEWEEVKIKDFDIVVTDFVANGSFASLKENVTLINDGPGYALFIRNTDLKSDFTQKVFVDEHAYNFLSKTKLFGGEVIISSVGDVGSVFRCPKFRIPMTLGNNVVMLKSKYNNFFYLFFNSDYGQSLIYGITSGSVQEKFNKTTFRDISIKYPSLDYIEEFEKLIKPYFDKIDNNKTQIRTLTTLRVTLLPKLMSGEVRVEY